jgi:hypothetical protein
VTATTTVPVNDLIDGGTGDGALAGDNAALLRRGDVRSPQSPQLTTWTMYKFTETGIGANFGAASRDDPGDAVGRDIILLDHSTLQADFPTAGPIRISFRTFSVRSPFF